MDIADMAEREIMNQVALSQHQSSMQLKSGKRELYPVGKCHYCSEEFEPDSPKLFCDNTHADMHHQKHKVSKW